MENFKPKVFELKDLSNRNLDIKTFNDKEYEMTIAYDTKTREIFVIDYYMFPLEG